MHYMAARAGGEADRRATFPLQALSPMEGTGSAETGFQWATA